MSHGKHNLVRGKPGSSPSPKQKFILNIEANKLLEEKNKIHNKRKAIKGAFNSVIEAVSGGRRKK